MPSYRRVQAMLSACLPWLAATQARNLALLTSAIISRRSLCLTELARAVPTPPVRRVAAPKHDLAHRLKRLWRFTANPRIDPIQVQCALIPAIIARLGCPRWLGLIVDWTKFDTVLPGGGRTRGRRIHYQILRIAIPRRGRALPLLDLAYDTYHLHDHQTGAVRSQNQLEQAALAAVLAALPVGVRPVVVADRGFARADLLAWLTTRQIDYVIRIANNTRITHPDGSSWKTSPTPPPRQLRPGQLHLLRGVRYGTYHDRPRDLLINLACSYRLPRARARGHPRPLTQPWWLATSLPDAAAAAAWYWQRGWIEQSFRDAKHRFGLDRVQVGCPVRLSRLLTGLLLALALLTLLALPETGPNPGCVRARVVTRGRPSLLTIALAVLEELGDFPPGSLPVPITGGYA